MVSIVKEEEIRLHLVTLKTNEAFPYQTLTFLVPLGKLLESCFYFGGGRLKIMDYCANSRQISIKGKQLNIFNYCFKRCCHL